jgi:hypothetical protein
VTLITVGSKMALQAFLKAFLKKMGISIVDGSNMKIKTGIFS